MANFRQDIWAKSVIGPAVSGAQVFWLNQPTTSIPTSLQQGNPTPLATAFLDTAGTIPLVQPFITDGFGHAWAYLEANDLYTVVIYNQGQLAEVLPDQTIPASGGLSGVTSVNGAAGAIQIVGGSGIAVSVIGGVITVAATGGPTNVITVTLPVDTGAPADVNIGDIVGWGGNTAGNGDGVIQADGTTPLMGVATTLGIAGGTVTVQVSGIATVNSDGVVEGELVTVDPANVGIATSTQLGLSFGVTYILGTAITNSGGPQDSVELQLFAVPTNGQSIIVARFRASTTITAGQVVQLKAVGFSSSVDVEPANNTVIPIGVAMQDATTGQHFYVCTFGICPIDGNMVGDPIIPGDFLGVNASAQVVKAVPAAGVAQYVIGTAADADDGPGPDFFIINVNPGQIVGAFVPTFDVIQTGTNVTATMTVGTGATLTVTGSGIINANQLTGDPVATAGRTTGQVLTWSGTAWAPSTPSVFAIAENLQTGTTYAIQDNDRSKRVTFSSATAVAASLPQANGSTFTAGWYTYVENINLGAVTITPTTSTINGQTSLRLFQWQWAMVFSDGTNYQALVQSLSSNDSPANLNSYLTNDAGTANAYNQLITRNINLGNNPYRKGLNIYLEHDGAFNSNYDGLQVNTGFTVDGFTTKATSITQGHTDGAEILVYGAVAQATFTSVANAGGGNTVYTGVIQNGANNGLVGLTYTIAGFSNSNNNGVFTVVASTSTTLTVNNASGVAESHSGTATPFTTFAIASVATAIGGSTVYTGVFPNGGSNFYAGYFFRIFGFTSGGNNGFFVCTASTATTLTLTSTTGIAETHVASAVWYPIYELNNLKLRWGSMQGGNTVNLSGVLQYLPNIQTNCNIDLFQGFAIDPPTGGGNIWTFIGVTAGTFLNSLSNVQYEIGLVAAAKSTSSVFGYAIAVTGGKTAGIVVNDDANTAYGYIGHANVAGGTPYVLHDGWYGSTGSPEGVISANVGSLFSRQDSTVGDPLYLKASGTGNTGWSPSSTVGPIKTVTGTYSATNSDGTINGNGTFTITLANTGVPVGKMFRIKNIGAGVITVSSTANIDSSTSLTLTALQSSLVQWDGTQYWIY